MIHLNLILLLLVGVDVVEHLALALILYVDVGFGLMLEVSLFVIGAIIDNSAVLGESLEFVLSSLHVGAFLRKLECLGCCICELIHLRFGCAHSHSFGVVVGCLGVLCSFLSVRIFIDFLYLITGPYNI